MTKSHEQTQAEAKESSPPEKSDAKSPGTQAPKKKKTPANIVVKVSWCKGCGLCVDYCTSGAIQMQGTLPAVVAAEKCTRCLQCEAICPDFAIEIDPPGHDDAAEEGEK